ncbi:MAG: hypothetical protein ABJB40_09820 [Acidobacteriota bacterium]
MSSEHITEEQGSNEPAESTEWVMPQPIFRSTEGHTPKTAPDAIYLDDLPTEIANKDESAFAKTLPDTIPSVDANADGGEDPDAVTDEAAAADADGVETDEYEVVQKTPPPAPPKAKGGCAKSFLFIVSMIGLAALAIIIAVVYFFFYYTPAETSTF